MNFVIRFIAGCSFRRWVAVAIGHRFLDQDGFFAGLGTDMRQIAQDAYSVHFRQLRDQSRTNPVTLISLCHSFGVVAHLDDTHAQILKGLNIAELIFIRCAFWKAHHRFYPPL